MRPCQVEPDMTAHERKYGSATISNKSWPGGVFHTAVDVKGMFVDAVDRNEPPDSEIVRYRWEDGDSPICALVRDKKTGAVSEYAVDIATGKLLPVIPPVAPPPKGNRPRPRESKLWRATKRWEER